MTTMHDTIDASGGRIAASLYRDADGHEVWKIALDGQTYAEGVASDHDAAWLVSTLAATLNTRAGRQAANR